MRRRISPTSPKIPLPELLQYNLVDAMATWFVYEKHYDRMVRDQQLDIYESLFQPAMTDIIQMQLTGMPLDIDQVRRVTYVLESIRYDAVTQMYHSPLIQKFHSFLAHEWAIKKNQELKVKRVTPNDFTGTFNPGSAPQLGKLLHEMIGLPVIDRTETKQPATGADTLEKLINHTDDPEVKKIIKALIDYKAVEKILSSFIPPMENAPKGPDDWHWLFGFFNLGGTVSGRLSSNGPNLQNLPANVYMSLSESLFERFKDFLTPFYKDGKLSLGKLIKSCFRAPPGWFFGGIDFRLARRPDLGPDHQRSQQAEGLYRRLRRACHAGRGLFRGPDARYRSRFRRERSMRSPARDTNTGICARNPRRRPSCSPMAAPISA